MSWLLAHYHPVGMFSLKPSSAFSSAGKTLLTPTPYAVKMALLRVAIQLEGVSSGAAAWPWLRNLYVAVRLPKDLIVTHTVQTMLRAEKKLNQSGRHKIAHHRPSPTYREYVYYPNTITLALRAPGLGLDWDQNKLSFWLSHIDYLGKRDGFLQLERTEMASELQDFVSLTEDGEYNKKGVLQLLDDCGKKMTFEHINAYSDQRPGKVGTATGRVIRQVVLPYMLIHSSTEYSHFTKLSGEP